MARKLSFEDKVHEIKSFLSLQVQIGSLKQFKYDLSFSQLLELNQLSKINMEWTQEQGLNTTEILYLKNHCFSKLQELFAKSIGHFFVIYTRMLYHKERSGFLEDNLQKSKVAENKQEPDLLESVFKNEESEDRHPLKIM
jgi:hypothetical protein